MKRLLVIAVLMITAAPAFAQRGQLDVPFAHGFIGRSKDLQDCRTVIQGDVSPTEMAKLMAVTRNAMDPANMADFFNNLR